MASSGGMVHGTCRWPEPAGREPLAMCLGWTCPQLSGSPPGTPTCGLPRACAKPPGLEHAPQQIGVGERGGDLVQCPAADPPDLIGRADHRILALECQGR